MQMYSNATISNISYNVTQMWYDKNDGQGNETNTRWHEGVKEVPVK